MRVVVCSRKQRLRLDSRWSEFGAVALRLLQLDCVHHRKYHRSVDGRCKEKTEPSVVTLLVWSFYLTRLQMAVSRSWLLVRIAATTCIHTYRLIILPVIF